MARPKKSKPNHATGMYEYKATIGKSFDGKAIRRSFYSSKSLEDAKEKARLYMIDKAVSEQTDELQVLTGTSADKVKYTQNIIDCNSNEVIQTNTMPDDLKAG